MILDERTEFADGVAVTDAGGGVTTNIGDIIDLLDLGGGANNGGARDLGNGQPIYAVIQVDVAPTGSDDVKFQIVSDGTSTIAVDGTQTVHFATAAEAIAGLPAGTQFVFALPPEGKVYENFLALQAVTTGVGALADLVVTAFLTLDPHVWKSYADASN